MGIRKRINKGLTQEQLGDMVGVGFRSVSKWERGITLPDISIINDVSKICVEQEIELYQMQMIKNSFALKPVKIETNRKE